jgi:hypothetical protein
LEGIYRKRKSGWRVPLEGGQKPFNAIHVKQLLVVLLGKNFTDEANFGAALFMSSGRGGNRAAMTDRTPCQTFKEPCKAGNAYVAGRFSSPELEVLDYFTAEKGK